MQALIDLVTKLWTVLQKKYDVTFVGFISILDMMLIIAAFSIVVNFVASFYSKKGG